MRNVDNSHLFSTLATLPSPAKAVELRQLDTEMPSWHQPTLRDGRATSSCGRYISDCGRLHAGSCVREGRVIPLCHEWLE
eukprot:362507-Chlamydomonas_euryale.AAC.20